MNSPPPYRDAARRLLGVGPESGTPELIASATRLLEEAHAELSNLIGIAGVEALEGRALRLARGDAPLLGAVVERNGNGIIGGLSGPLAHADPEELHEALVAFLAHLLGLMASLLGEEITLRLLRRIRPDVEPGNAIIGEQPGEVE